MATTGLFCVRTDRKLEHRRLRMSEIPNPRRPAQLQFDRSVSEALATRVQDRVQFKACKLIDVVVVVVVVAMLPLPAPSLVCR